MVIHLENRFVSSQEEHEAFKESIFEYADIFDKWGALPTWDAREPINTCVDYNDPYLKELADRGHGVGVHLDLGGDENTQITYNQLVDALKGKKEKLEWQGIDVNHVSGICSPLDWQSAVVEADYKFVSGIVEYCLASTPEVLPSDWDCTSASQCHNPYPYILKERMHPWRSKPGNWTQSDPNGNLVIMPTSETSIACLSESFDNIAFEDCEVSSKDIDISISVLESALLQMEPDKTNTFFLAWSYGKEFDKDLLELYLERINEQVEQGHVVWKTIPEMYEGFIALE